MSSSPVRWASYLPDAVGYAEAGFHFSEGGCWGMALALQAALGGSLKVASTPGGTHAWVQANGWAYDDSGATRASGYPLRGDTMSVAGLMKAAARHGVPRDEVLSDAEWASRIVKVAQELAEDDVLRSNRRVRPNQGSVPPWLLRPELATEYALEHFPGAYHDQQFEGDAEERVLEYSRFASEVNGTGSVTVYRAFDVPIGSVDLSRLGKSWSARLRGAYCYGGGQGRGWGAKAECRVVVEGVLAAGDVDWPYSFESFLMYGPGQYEVAPRSHAPVLVTAVYPLRGGRRATEDDRQPLDPAMLGSVGEALEEWREVRRNPELLKKGTRLTGSFADDGTGWRYSGDYPSVRGQRWVASLGLARGELSVQGATEYDPGFRAALVQMTAEYPELLDLDAKFDGPRLPIAALVQSGVPEIGQTSWLHGTSSAALDSITSRGLRPRWETGAAPAFVGAAKESRPEYVYLTTQRNMARMAARAAARVGGGIPVVLRVEPLPVARMQPDEDSGMDTAEESLWRIGSVAFEGSIAPSKIAVDEILKDGEWSAPVSKNRRTSRRSR